MSFSARLRALSPLPRRVAGVGRSGLFLWLALTAVLPGPALLAHDVYLLPTTFRVDVGAPVALQLGVGHAFRGAPLPYEAERTRIFLAESSAGERVDVPSVEGAVPAGVLRLDRGDWTVVYGGRPWIQTLDRPALERHLKEVGHAALIEPLRPRFEARSTVRERVVRCASALLTVGNPRESTRWTSTRTDPACRFEIVPVERRGDRLTIAVRRDGRPVAGARVVATDDEGHGHHHGRVLETDDAGRLTLQLQGRRWLLTGIDVRVETAAPGGTESVDLHSDWASLSIGPTLGVRPQS